jgi:RNA polymerase sigma-70 factor (ECF subfamily)
MTPQPLAGRILLPVAVVTMEDAREFVDRTYEAERLVVFRYLLSLGLDREDALDLTQETFLQLYRAATRGDEIRVARAWLLTVASRIAINFHHAQGGGLRRSVDEPDKLIESLPDHASGPEAAALHRERLAVLLRAYRELSPQQKVCVHLRAEGLRYREIADALGVTISTVSEFMRRATARLRSAING